MTDTNLRISEVALDLLAWDKRRATSPMDPADFVETERLIDRGANFHRRLLAALHEELDEVSLVESEEWLVESRARWKDREEMTERGGFLRGRKLKLTKDDLARIDRVHPEHSFSASSPVSVEIPFMRSAMNARSPTSALTPISLGPPGVLNAVNGKSAAATMYPAWASGMVR